MSYSRGPGDDLYMRAPRPAGAAMYSPPERAPSSGHGLSMGIADAQEGPGVFPWLMGAFFAIFLLYLLYLQTRSDVGTNGTLRAASDLFVLFGSATCALTCWYTAATLRRMGAAAAGVMAGRAWLAWALLGGAAFGYSVGQGIWTWYDANYTSANLPFPAIYDPFYLSVYPLSWIGIALLIPRSGSAAGRTRLLLDAAIAVASALAITWYFILGPTITTLMGPTLTKVVALAYPLGDLSLCVAAALLLFGPSGATALNASLGRLAIGVTWLAITDSLYGYGQLQGTYHTGLLQDIGWPMSWLFIGWAALVYPVGLARLTGQRLSPDQFRHTSRLSTAGAALRAITPMVLALVTCAILLLVVALRNTAPLFQVVFVCAGLFLLPVVRQLLTLVDNLILNDRLRRALDQSQQAFQHSQQALMDTSLRADRYDELRAGIEQLQAVHAVLARGDLSARARVEGPLAPVAQSLNLFIERLTRWAQFVQANQVLENEANYLRQVLDGLSEGRVAPFPPSRSTLPTGGALVAAGRLQRQLALHFERLRGLVDLIGRNGKTTSDNIRRARQLLQESALAQQQVLDAQETLAQVENGFFNSQALLQELWLQADLYRQSPQSAMAGSFSQSSGDLPFAGQR